MKFNTLFKSAQVGSVEVNNRIVMAPMTRCRADNPDLCPTELHALYYSQRATAGLIISEGTVVSPLGTGYVNVPGLYSKEQTESWKMVTDKVHSKGGKIVAQLWHVGRVTHPDFLNGYTPVAPSALNPEMDVHTATGKKSTVVPRALSVDEIKNVIQEFVTAAKNAKKAGFDGIEIHAANGYLFHQFFNNCSNVRTDEYGGSNENKTRILFELLDRLKAEVADLNVGVRLNPMLHGMLGMHVDEETASTFDYLVEQLNEYPLAYLHICRPFRVLEEPYFIKNIIPHYRSIYKGFLIANGNYSPEEAEDELAAGNADAVSFARHFIANPDLVYKIQNNLSLNKSDPSTHYSPGEKGYTDYSFHK